MKGEKKNKQRRKKARVLEISFSCLSAIRFQDRGILLLLILSMAIRFLQLLLFDWKGRRTEKDQLINGIQSTLFIFCPCCSLGSFVVFLLLFFLYMMLSFELWGDVKVAGILLEICGVA